MSSIDDIFARAEGLHKTIAVTAAADDSLLHAVQQALDIGIVHPILIGDTPRIRKIAAATGVDLTECELIEADDPEESVRVGMQLIREGRARILMKGLVNTRDFLKIVLDKSHGVEISGLLAHLALFFPDFYSKPVLISDAGLNLFPAYEQKLIILRHGIEVLHRLGVERPRVAVLAHNEMATEKVPASMEAVRLVEAGRRGELPECVIEGPLSLDLALDSRSCQQKSYDSPVGGRADMLLCPDILSGNILYKSMTVIGDAPGAAFIAGGNVPIILTSRGDATRTKLLSIAFAAAAC